MDERRNERRFDLKLPCLLSVMKEDERDIETFHQMETLNISLGGAFLSTANRFGLGERVELEMVVRLGAGDAQSRPPGSCIHISGQVVRCEPGGMAVKFIGQYHMLSIDKLIAMNRTRIQWLEMVEDGIRPPVKRVLRSMPEPPANAHHLLRKRVLHRVLYLLPDAT